MTIDWPVAFIIMIALAACAGVASEFIKRRASSAQNEAGAQFAEQYRIQSSNYESLVKELSDTQADVRTALVDLNKKVDNIEKILREVS
ncbi:MAG: hypothetical protein P4L50_25980 [Anaerolineaceae bacterium]|nr:hypothetical protein [Anaerolineaceae bacterium]